MTISKLRRIFVKNSNKKKKIDILNYINRNNYNLRV